MGWTKKIKRNIAWMGGVAAALLWFIFAEGWLILIVKLFGFWGGTAIITLVTLILAWIVIFLASGAGKIGRFSDWLKAEEAKLSGKAKAAAGAGKALVVANTAIFLGPMFAAILMLMFGLERGRVYIYSILCSLLCAVVWSGFYSGIFWGIRRIVLH